VRKEKLETFVLDKLLTVILAPENLDRLVELVNEELVQDRERIEEEVARLEREIAGYQSRLSRLFDALETGKLELEDLAPRIKELRQAIERLEDKRETMIEEGEARRAFQVDKKTVLSYVRDLKRVLAEGSLSEQKMFLAGVIKKIIVNDGEIDIEYRIPQPELDRAESLPPVLELMSAVGEEGRQKRVPPDVCLPQRAQTMARGACGGSQVEGEWHPLLQPT